MTQSKSQQPIIVSLGMILLLLSKPLMCQILNPYVECKGGKNDFHVTHTYGPPATLFNPGFSYSFGIGVLIRWNKYIGYHLRAQHYALGYTIDENLYPEYSGLWRQFAAKTALGVQFNFGRFTVEPALEYNHVYKNWNFGVEDFDNPNFWQGSLTVGYKALPKYHFEPYVQWNRGISPANNFVLGGAEGLRRVFPREIMLGFKTYLFKDKLSSATPDPYAGNATNKHYQNRRLIPFVETAYGINQVQVKGQPEAALPYEHYEPVFSMTTSAGVGIRLNGFVSINPFVGYQYRATNLIQQDVFGLIKYGALQSGVGIHLSRKRLFFEPALAFNTIIHKSNQAPFQSLEYENSSQVNVTVGGKALNRFRIDPFFRLAFGLQPTHHFALNIADNVRKVYTRELLIGARYQFVAERKMKKNHKN
jgi:hypothetical protein